MSRAISIEISRKSLVLIPRQSVHLRLVVKTDDGGLVYPTISYESSNASVADYTGASASFESNEQIIGIHAYSVGTTDIKFYHPSNKDAFSIVHVVVVADESQLYNPVLDVTISESSVTVPTSSTFTLVGRQVSDGSSDRKFWMGSYQIVEAQASASLVYSSNVRFVTSDSSIASISETYNDSSTSLRAEIQTGSREGTAEIYAISNEDSTKKAVCTVKVEASNSPSSSDTNNPVVSVSISESSIEIAEYEYRRLEAIVTGQYSDQSSVNRSVIWISSNVNVVGVNSAGVVVGISVGTAVVTAVSVENRDVWGNCTVTVRKRKESDGPIVLPGEEPANGIDTIVRVDYNEDGTFSLEKLFEGDLNFDTKNPIESVVYHETDDIQKIYWVDGRNVLRFMNFMEKPDNVTGLYPWQFSDGSYDRTYFDSNRTINFGVDVNISKDNSGNTRPNGVVQYLLTYYNKHGQESGYAWISDLIYLSPVASGGAADGTNNNSVTLKFSNLDVRFSHFRVYSIFRSSLNGETVAYIVFDGKTDRETIVVVDNNSHLVSVDASRLLYLGSQNVVANTLTHKDQTLFLGDLSSVGRDYDNVEKTIRKYMILGNGWESANVSFVYDSKEIPNETGAESYSYNNQLVRSSSEITSFKGGEKYRFGIVFQKKDGSFTDAFWIGDKVNHLYPKMSDSGITRVIAECSLPGDVVSMMSSNGFSTAQLMIAEATYADRAVKAQGIVCPTVFNVWNRYMGRMYSASSWIMRPRNSEYAWKHFEVVHNSTSSTGEIDCNYWETTKPHPYYILNNYNTSKEYAEEFDGKNEYSYAIVLYRIKCHKDIGTFWINKYSAGATVILAKPTSGTFNPSYSFTQTAFDFLNDRIINNASGIFTYTDSGIELKIHNLPAFSGSNTGNTSKTDAWADITSAIRDHYGFLSENELVKEQTFYSWCDDASNHANEWRYYNNALSGKRYSTIDSSLNDRSDMIGRWYVLGEENISSGDFNYSPSYYKKHLMFVDENVVTLNSPEIEYGAISFDKTDGHMFRIVGVAKIDSNYSDYTVNAAPGKLSGENLVREQLKKPLIAWPLWKELGLDQRTKEESSGTDPEDHYVESDVKDRDSYDYVWGGGFVKYWLRMWNHAGKISGYTDYDNNEYSLLHNKIFANARYSKKTTYRNYDSNEYRWEYEPQSIRIFNYISSQYVGINIGDEYKYYNGTLNDSLSLPGNHKYPALYSIGISDPEKKAESTKAFLYLSDPVPITFASSAHAVISLPTQEVSRNGRIYYEQVILPKWDFKTSSTDPEFVNIPKSQNGNTGALIPWIDNSANTLYPYEDYSVKQDSFRIENSDIRSASKYVYIGEIYYPFIDGDQIRYGGTSDAAIRNTRFLIAGPQYNVASMIGNGLDVMIANQADTYIQRWDCLKTKPLSSDCVNGVIDITSVMLETHINIDGRTDLQRGTSYIASIDTEKFGQINPVYSQANNFIAKRDLDEDFNLDSYRSSVTWTLEKHDSEDIDEWSHITLASTLKLDGDKGNCQALRRMGNSIIAFQDRGISEILFNSRTQLSTQDGVPVEIANSGKVDGKRYITNKYGCVNKWSIIEGKNALYFVDNINKAFCSFNGQAIDNLSTRLGFGAWFREINNTDSWNPASFNNIVSYYDKIHSDVYLVRGTEDDKPCLVYNETLGAFTSFFDYKNVLMMSNVGDRFVSFNRHSLWLQNEGPYCNFFGKQYDYWTQYRVTPDPFGDKIWTNIDYRADFFEVLNDNAEPVVSETELINGDIDDTYKEWETFTDYKVWDEYQDTGFTPFTHDSFDRDDVRKKFRIWRLTIPRALKEGTNKHGMDRIRNPWINLLFRKNNVDGKYLMQLHDIVVKYFE